MAKTKKATKAAKSGRKRSLSRRLSVAFVSLALGLLIAELVLRCFLPIYLAGYIGAYQHDEELGVCLKPGQHFLKSTDYQQEVRTNQKGTVNFQESFEGYDSIVLAIGDSYTQGTGLPSDATYPFQLDLLLNMRRGEYRKRCAVVNLGLAAFGGEQELLSLQRYAKLVGKPKYVLFLGCANDYVDDLLFKNGDRHKLLVDGNPHWGMFLKPLQWLTNETEIGKRLKIGVALMGAASPPDEDEEAPANPHPRSTAQLQEPVLEKLVAMCKELDAGLVVSWADPPGDSSGSYEWLKGWAGDNRVDFADWHSGVTSVREAVPDLPLWNPHSGGHYRTWVNGMIAAAFAEHIRD